MMNQRHFFISLLLLISSIVFLLGSRFVGKVLISAEFTRGFFIGVSLALGTAALVWLMVEACTAAKTKNG